jgi:S1-C subfamily serine protease
MPIDDSFVPALCQLPLTESLRLFGTAITEQGKLEIAQQLDGLEIYRGNGGFLGIASDVLKPVVVSSVQPNSAAQNAGIEEGDIVTEIQGEPIKDFANLKATIAKYSPNEMLLIKLKRPRKDPTDPTGQRQLGFFELQLFVVLNEQAN